MAESGYGLAGWEWDRQNLSISTGLRRVSAVLLRYHMKQWSAAFHAAGAASVNNQYFYHYWGRLRERAKSYAKALANDILR
ncbi:hypothetical protein ACV24J_005581 [Escherichia coli]|nr:hypothetical protein [Escherichia coli]HDD8988717.1 hypothetical protein [Escherichia coli]